MRHRLPPPLPAAQAICLILLAIVGIVPQTALADEPAHADDPEQVDAAVDDAPEAAGPEPAPPAVSASTDALYDFTALAAQDARYAAVLDAFRRKQWRTVVLDAPAVADGASSVPTRMAALLLLAQAHDKLGQAAKAEQAWQRLAQSGPLAQRARQALAELALQRKDVDSALAQLAAVASWHVGRDAATLRMAQLELGRGQTGPARDALDRVQVALLSRNQRGLLACLRGEVARRSGQMDAAADRYREAWLLDEAPHSALAAARLAELGAAPSPSDQIERILRRRSAEPAALRGWLAEAESITEEGGGLRAYVQGALLARDKPTRRQAIERLQVAVSLLQEPVQLGRALYALGDALGKAHDDAAAVAHLQRIETLLWTGVQTPGELRAFEEVKARALQRLHKIHAGRAENGQAGQALRQLLDQHPQAAERELAVWGLGWQQFLAGDHAKALKEFVRLDGEFGHLWTGAGQPWRAKAMYWQARCLHALGQTEAALEAWATVTTNFAQTYYGVVALDRIRELDAARAARLQGPPPSPAEVHALTLSRVRVTRHPALDEAVLLIRAGLSAEAQAVLRGQLAAGLPRDGIHLLATLYEQDGRQRAAYGVLQRHTRRAARPDDATAAVWRQSFPTPFLVETEAASQQARIGKALLYAIMRHESHFNPNAVSKANAHGLVQLLPNAAKAVAELHGVPVQGVQGLYKPGYNLQVGALYLAQLLSFFGGNQGLAAAAYNCGPYATKGWVQRWKDLPTDAFVETIPYPATRAYVMQVTATAQTYAWLYPEWGEIERDGLARNPMLPRVFGPFMVRPPADAVMVD